MGIVKAFMNAVSGNLADSWLEIIEAGPMSDTTVFTITKNTVSPVFEEKMCSLLAREGLNPTVEGSPNYEY